MSDNNLMLAVLAYNLALVSGTAYLVEAHGWSMWTFLLAGMFFVTTKRL
jgi:hypothetical protein